MAQPQSGQGRPNFARKFLIWIVGTIVQITIGIISNYAFTYMNIIPVVVIFLVASLLAELLEHSLIPFKIPFSLPTIRIGPWPQFSSSELLTIASTIVLTVVALPMIIVGLAAAIDASKYVSLGDEKDLARNYCVSLQKQDYHRIYSYFKDGTDGLTIGGQLIDDENRFVALARAADTNGKVNDCRYQSATAQKNSYTCEAGGETCDTKYKMTLLLRRGGTSYITSMLLTVTTGSYGEFGHISVIDKL